jgi:hypothetical protein
MDRDVRWIGGESFVSESIINASWVSATALYNTWPTHVATNNLGFFAFSPAVVVCGTRVSKNLFGRMTKTRMYKAEHIEK